MFEGAMAQLTCNIQLLPVQKSSLGSQITEPKVNLANYAPAIATMCNFSRIILPGAHQICFLNSVQSLQLRHSCRVLVFSLEVAGSTQLRATTAHCCSSSTSSSLFAIGWNLGIASWQCYTSRVGLIESSAQEYSQY